MKNEDDLVRDSQKAEEEIEKTRLYVTHFAATQRRLKNKSCQTWLREIAIEIKIKEKDELSLQLSAAPGERVCNEQPLEASSLTQTTVKHCSVL